MLMKSLLKKHTGGLSLLAVSLIAAGAYFAPNAFNANNIKNLLSGNIDAVISAVIDEVKKEVKDGVKDLLNQPSKHHPLDRKKSENYSVNNSYTPKGNKQEFCNLNVYNGQRPMFSATYAGNGSANELIDLCYHGYRAMYKHQYKSSIWVAEKLTLEREKEAQEGEREQRFYQDPTLLKLFGDNQTIKHEDYTRIGNKEGFSYSFDRGHLGASRNMAASDRFESFYMSNIILQTSANNQNIWRKIESSTRCLLKTTKSDVYVVTIPVFFNEKNQVGYLTSQRGVDIALPQKIAKAVYVPEKGIAGVYLTNNDASTSHYEVISVKKLFDMTKIMPFVNMPEKDQLKSALPNPHKNCSA